MYATIRRIALVVAGALALVAGTQARAHGDLAQPIPQSGPPPAYAPPAPTVRPAPAWLQVERELIHQYRWLEKVRSRFYRHWAWNPWRVSQFEAWYRTRRAELDRRWYALARAPGRWRGWADQPWGGSQPGAWRHGRWEGEGPWSDGWETARWVDRDFERDRREHGGD